MIKRIFFDLLLFGMIFYLPWWIVAPIALWGAFSFPTYYEIFAFGVTMDVLYGIPTSSFHGLLSLVGATILFFLGQLLRSMVRPMYR